MKRRTRLRAHPLALAALTATTLTAAGSDAYALQLEAVVTEDDPTPGGYFTLRMVVANDGATDISGVQVTATLPPDLRVYTARSLAAGLGQYPLVPTCPATNGYPTQCTFGEDMTVAVGALAAGQSVPIEIRYDILSAASGVKSFTVGASATGITASSFSVSANVYASASASMAVAARKQLISASEDVTVEIEFRNVGAAPWSSATLTASLPTGASLVSADAGGRAVAGGVQWTLGPWLRGAIGHRAFTMRLPSGTQVGDVFATDVVLRNGSTVVSSGGEVIAVGDARGIELSVTEGEMGRFVGERNRYRVVVSNTSANSAFDVRLHALSGVNTILSDTDEARATVAATCIVASGYPDYCEDDEWITWSLGTLPAGESRVVFVPLRMLTGANDFVTAPRFRASSLGMVGVLGTNLPYSPLDPTDTNLRADELSMVVAASEQTVAAGDEVEFTVYLGNEGAGFTGLDVIARLPDRATLVSADAGYTQSGDILTWSLSGLSNSETRRFRYRVAIPSTAAVGEIHASTVEVRQGTSLLARTGDSVIVRPNSPLDLSVVTGGNGATPSERSQARVLVSNRGTTRITDLSLEALVPEFTNLSDVDEATPTPICRVVAGYPDYCEPNEWIGWSSFDLEAGESRVFILPVLFDGNLPNGRSGLLRAQLSQLGRVLHSTRAPLVVASGAPSLSLSARSQAVQAGGLVPMQVWLDNPTSTTLANAALTVALPPGAAVASVSDQGSTNAAGDLAWTLSSVPAGTRVARTFTLRIPSSTVAGAGAIHELRATLGAQDRIPAQSGESLAVVGSSPLRFAVEAPKDRTTQSEKLWYRATVTNVSATDMVGVFVQALPPRHGVVNDSTLARPVPTCVSLGYPTYCDYREWVSWDLGVLPAGGTRTIDLPVAMLSGTNGKLEEAWFLAGAQGLGYTAGRRVMMSGETAVNTQLGISASTSAAQPGSTVRLEARYAHANTGASDDCDLVVELPTGVSFLASSARGTLTAAAGNDPAEVRWSLGAIPGESAGSVWIEVGVDSATPMGSILQFDARLERTQSAGSIARTAELVLVESAPPVDVSVERMSSPAVAQRTEVLRYRVTNRSSQRLEQVRLESSIAASTVVNQVAEAAPVEPRTPSADPIWCDDEDGYSNYCAPSGWMTRDIGTLRAGESRVLDIPILIDNLSSVAVLETRTRLTDATSTFVGGRRDHLLARRNNFSLSPGPEFRVDAQTAAVAPGARTGLTVFVGNPSAASLEGLVVEVLLDPELSLPTPSPAGTVATAGGFLVPAGNLLAGHYLALSFPLDVAAGTARGELLEAVVNLRGRALERSSLASARVSFEVDDRTRPVLAARLDASAGFSVGSQLTLTATLTNPTAAGRTDARISVNMPETTSVQAASLASDGSCIASRGYATLCSTEERIGFGPTQLAAGDTYARSFDAQVGSPAPVAGRLLTARFIANDATLTQNEVVLSRTIGVGTRQIPGASIDSDNDGIPDEVELTNGLDYLDGSDAGRDFDNDGLTNAQEFNLGTNLRSDDTDSDGIRDGCEVAFATSMPATDPLDAMVPPRNLTGSSATDADGDGISDTAECSANPRTNPADPSDPRVQLDPNDDEDGDGMSNGYELANGLDPYVDDSALDPDADGATNLQEYGAGTLANVADTDADGFLDGWELANTTDPLDPNDPPASADSDNDGLTNAAERAAGTNPADADSDDDGFSDGWEVMNMTDPLEPTDPPDSADSDGDGVINGIERQNGWDPTNPDTDGDGFDDGWEVTNMTDPANPNDPPGSADSDGDGFSNSVERAAGTDPSDATDFPSAPVIEVDLLGPTEVEVGGMAILQAVASEATSFEWSPSGSITPSGSGAGLAVFAAPAMAGPVTISVTARGPNDAIGAATLLIEVRAEADLSYKLSALADAPNTTCGDDAVKSTEISVTPSLSPSEASALCTWKLLEGILTAPEPLPTGVACGPTSFTFQGETAKVGVLVELEGTILGSRQVDLSADPAKSCSLDGGMGDGGTSDSGPGAIDEPTDGCGCSVVGTAHGDSSAGPGFGAVLLFGGLGLVRLGRRRRSAA